MLQTISKNKLSKLRELHTQKGRNKYGLYFAETHKIFEFVYSSKLALIDSIYCLESWYEKYLNSFDFENIDVFILDQKELKNVSLLKNPHDLLFTLKREGKKEFREIESSSIVLFDTIQDPGNFGTIIRTLAWFGVKQIVCSLDSVSIHNPKVIQASMGAFTLVDVFYIPIHDFINSHPEFEYFTTDMQGKNIYKINTKKERKYGIIFGNEGSGISDEIRKRVKNTISIPPKSNLHPESLNLSISVGIVLSNLLQP